VTAGGAVLVLAALAPTAPAGGVVSVRTEPAAEGGAAVTVVLATPEVPAEVRREGARVVIEVAGGAPAALELPPPLTPVVGIASEAPGEAGGTRLVLAVAAPFEYESRREGRELRLRIAAAPDADDTETLARMLFPPEDPAAASTAAAAGAEEELPPASREPRVRLRPSLSALYATGTNGFEEGPQPEDDSYWDVGPRIEALSGPARVSYEAHLRGGSRYPEVNSMVTHLVDARLERQLASDTHVQAGYEFLRGRQQANAVDPAGEYFYGFEPFRKHTADARARVPVGGATAFVVGGTWDQVRFDAPGAFVDFSLWTAQAGVRREIGGQTSLELLYTRDEVYESTDRNVDGTTADTVNLSLVGEVRPMLHVLVLGGLSRRHSPGAPGDARDVTDVLARVDVRREFSEATAVQLGYQRSRNISAFEANPSYRSDFVEARAYAPLPYDFPLAVSGGFRQNTYPLPAAGGLAPRRDRIFGWTVGLGHTVGSRTMLHLEYRWLRRQSNVPGLSSDSHGFLVQLDVTPRRDGGRP
jgi:hypothetical protein